MRRTAESPPLTVFKTATETYTPDQLVSTSTRLSLYSAHDSQANPAWVVHTSRMAVGTAVCGEDHDAESTAPFEPLAVPWRDRGEEGGCPFFVFLRSPGLPAALGLRCTWDPHRIDLLTRILDALRDARDRGVHLAWCTWDSLFLGPQGEVRWLSPVLPGCKDNCVFPVPAIPVAPPAAEPVEQARTEEAVDAEGRSTHLITVQTLDVLRHAVPQEVPASLAQDEKVRLERRYQADFRAMLSPLVLVSFNSAPPPPSPDGQARPLPVDLDHLLAEQEEPAPHALGAVMSVELRGTLDDFTLERTVSLDEMREALERYGSSHLVRLRSGWGTHRGLVRDSNEDALLVLEQSTVAASRPLRMVLYAVADGMGGHEAGEVASELTLKALAIELVGGFNLTSRHDHHLDVRNHGFLRSVAARAIDQANHVLRSYTMESHADARRRPGSTLVFALCVGPMVTLGHVGDSRAYRFTRELGLQRLTRDHSLVQSLVDQEKLTAEEAFHHPFRHQILSNMGLPPERLRKDLQTHYLKENECLLLCSDGLTDMLQDHEVEALVRKQGTDDPRRLTRALIDAACEHGGHDNITVIVVVRPVSPSQDQRETATKVSDTSKRELP